MPSEPKDGEISSDDPLFPKQAMSLYFPANRPTTRPNSLVLPGSLNLGTVTPRWGAVVLVRHGCRCRYTYIEKHFVYIDKGVFSSALSQINHARV
jgi:hypothetical protein